MLNTQLTLYTGSGYSDWEIGDITIIIHEGVYHLFHLIIPNHDYIAHAVSKDGLSWKRVKNALFVGDPGDWDDDMLWTMHVCKTGDRFEMYYTGLQRKDRGIISRVGLAISGDLYNWEKTVNDIFPFGSENPYYESINDNPRKWLSFRDPYRYDHEGEIYFLICARACYGPISRRGCVGLIHQKQDRIEYLPPLHFPMVYDDVECPGIFYLNGKYYLIGSIREDVKVRYWFCDNFLGEYHCFHANVLLPQGNYAARVVPDGEHLLLFSFFYTYGRIDSLRVLVPPKQLDTDEKGRLLIKSYFYWEQIVVKSFSQQEFNPVKILFDNPTAIFKVEQDKWIMTCRSGYEIFSFDKPGDNFIWEGVFTVEGIGKLGIVCDMDDEGNGYYIAFDVVNGQVQIRSWGFNPLDYKTNFKFIVLQDSIFRVNDRYSHHFKLLRYGNYIELSIDGNVKLTLIDYLYSGKGIGFYSASSAISLKDSILKILPDPEKEY